MSQPIEVRFKEIIRDLAQLRTFELTEDKELYLQVAAELEKTNQRELVKRAEFIRRQCSGDNAEDLFNENRESWGIPNFREELVTVEDFRRGFLYKFRDHTTSWGDDQKAREWFLTSFEATFVQVYEFWTCDNGPEEVVETKTGNYKAILNSLLVEGAHEVLISPAFSKQELDEFVKTYQPTPQDFSMEEIVEMYIQENPNY